MTNVAVVSGSREEKIYLNACDLFIATLLVKRYFSCILFMRDVWLGISMPYDYRSWCAICG